MKNFGLPLSAIPIPQYEFRIKKSSRGQFYWIFHNKIGNTEPVCWSEEYTTLHACRNSIGLVKGFAAGAPINDSEVKFKPGLGLYSAVLRARG